MSDVKWIKLQVDIFDNRKIKQIRKLPEGTDICLMWFQLMCLAGQINNYGQVYITQDIPYTVETLATEFDMPLQTVKLGLKVFEQFGMIEVIDNILKLSSWERYQSLESRDKYREYQRNYHREYRAKQKALANPDNVNNDVNVLRKGLRKCDVNTQEERRKNKEKEEESEERDIERKPTRHKYGEYKNVLLSDDDLGKLKAEFPNDWQDRIERLSEYIAQTGKTYKNYLATIRAWARKDKGQPQAKPVKQEQRKGSYFVEHTGGMSYEDYMKNAVSADEDEDDDELPFGIK